jgi:hypothetical protein
MENGRIRIQTMPGEIAKIHAHLKAGHEVALITYTHCTIMDKPLHVDYIRADGNGYRLGWPGKKSVYCFAENIFLIAPGFSLQQKRGRKR